MLYKEMFSIIEDNFSNRGIEEGDTPLFKNIFNRQSVIEILKDILTREDLIKKIADRSYTHALGFDKIILADLSKDSISKRKNQVRLHIWEPANNSLPIVEALHEHSFDFISTVLSGHLENQRFIMSELSEDERALIDIIKKTKDLKFVNEQIEILEALKLKELGSKQFDDLGMEKNLNIKKLGEVLGLSKDDVLRLTILEGHYVSNRVAGEKKAYAHVLRDYVALNQKDVLQINEGEYYFHPYTLAHRLYYDNKVLNSTILVTTHVENNPEGGSLQRPSYVQKEEQHYDKISFSYERMRKKLESYIKFLESR